MPTVITHASRETLASFRRASALLSLLLLTPFATSDGQRRTPTERLDSLFASVRTDSTPGCAVGITRSGDAPVFRSYGLANLEQRSAIDTATVFEAGSVSKQITAAAVLLLAGEGRLSLSDPVSRWIPELWSGLPAISVGDLLHHVSGLRDFGDLFELSGWPRGSRTTDNADVLHLLARQRALNFRPRAEYLYSNSNFVLAALIVERASGMNFGTYTQRAIFAPLSMHHTSWRDDYTRIVRNRAQGYTPNDSSRWVLDMPFENSVGHGGLLTTVADLMRWQQRFMLTSDASAAAVGGAEFVRNMEAQITLTSGRVSGYALGLEIGSLAGERIVTHGGWTAGYKSYVGRMPSRGVAVALLCNAGSLNTEEIGEALLGIAADVPVANYYAEPQLGPAADTSDARSLARLAGLYRSERTRQPVRVRAFRDGITVNSWTGYRRVTDSTLQSLDGNRTVRFLFDRVGRATGYRISQLADTVQFTRVSETVPDSRSLDALSGTYRCGEADTDIEILRVDGALVLQRRGRLRDALKPRYADAFEVATLGWLLTIRRDAGSRIAGVDLGISRTRTLPCTRLGRSTGG